MNRLSCSPQSPAKSEIIEYSDVSELYPDTDRAIFVFLAALKPGSFVIWAESRTTRLAITQPRAFADESVALAHFHELVHDLLEYAHPAARS